MEGYVNIGVKEAAFSDAGDKAIEKTIQMDPGCVKCARKVPRLQHQKHVQRR